ncbi:DUF3783 domain-containing protein [Vallitalea pronyensis]|uniref:DUF3783 domain-containing protein n=1 Tax=Vallitalea pronyensis TaxID=1348613 RepID=A0A8J8MJY6_9FIRM|nr:DUF3783 domain-containing protein [Vallitalea pronyensis]QUI22658.1 DUF3783 domain-containing protein [Vallitalea pronyensis]
MSFEQINKQDTHRPEGRPCLMIYGYDTTEIKQITAFANGMGIEDCVLVTDTMLGNKIEDILNNQLIPTPYKTGVKPKSIILNALSNGEVHTFISDFKKLELKKPLFAVVTPTSKKWQFGELLKELVREKMSMSKH